ncbi:MAG TPA: L-threonylcarbamoyladenylate synthase [Candidatus Limnocylindrales bacterium]|nr:L-threonylcarbamoyladenylate synthase [Candidatus Limnocylindrales bacterium]
MTDRLATTEEGISRAAAILRSGGLVAFPTDTVYGVACAASRPEAVEAIFALKRRPAERQIPMLVGGVDDIASEEWAVDERVRDLAARFWPGPLTLVVPSRDGGSSQAFRAPDHPIALALIEAAGPLFTTSANVSGEPDTLDADDVLIAFATQADTLAAVVDGGRVPRGVASTVLDLIARPAAILRDGPIGREALAERVELATAP